MKGKQGSRTLLYILLTLGSIVSLGILIFVGNAIHFNPTVIPSISEIISESLILKCLFVIIVFTSQTTRIILYSQVEEHITLQKSSPSNGYRVNLLLIALTLTYAQTILFLLVAIIDVDQNPTPHFAVAGSAFLIAIVRQFPFLLLSLNITKISNYVRLLELATITLLIGLLIPFGVISVTSEIPHPTIALTEYIAAYVVLILPMFNYSVVQSLEKSRESPV